MTYKTFFKKTCQEDPCVYSAPWRLAFEEPAISWGLGRNGRRGCLLLSSRAFVSGTAVSFFDIIINLENGHGMIDMHCGRASQPLLGITLVSRQAKHQSRVHQQLLPFPCKLLQLLLNLNLLRRSSICRPIDHSVSSQAFCQPLLCQSDLKVIFKHNFLIFLNITFLLIDRHRLLVHLLNS